MKRALRPRATAALVVAPVTVTDRSSYAVLGVDDLRTVVRALGCKHTIVGKRMIVVVADFVAALEAASSRAPSQVDAPVMTSAGPSADQILARIGRSRAA